MGIVHQEGPSLARGLGPSLRTLCVISNRIPTRYHRTEVLKRGGGVRVLRIPDPMLKDIRRRIARMLLSGMSVSSHVITYRYGVGVMENTWRYVDCPGPLRLNILHFFGNTCHIQVKEVASLTEIYAGPPRVLFSILYYNRDIPPQDALILSWIANLVLYLFGERLRVWCRVRGVVYTRYCDSLASPGTALDGVGERAEEGLRVLGFRSNQAKRVPCQDGQQGRVIGLVVNERAAVLICRRRGPRQKLYLCRSRGIEEHSRAAGLTEGRGQCLRYLLGQVDFWLQV